MQSLKSTKLRSKRFISCLFYNLFKSTVLPCNIQTLLDVLFIVLHLPLSFKDSDTSETVMIDTNFSLY